MLAVLRTMPTGAGISTSLNASVSIRDGNKNIEGYSDLGFSIGTYQKIAKDERNKADSNDENIGDMILLPINLFFKTLNLDEQSRIYEMYSYCKRLINLMTIENRREVQDKLQIKIFDTINFLDLSTKMINFCRTTRFEYPDLNDIGKDPHHTKEKTYELVDYIELTAISVLSKMMVPIWGELVRTLGDLGIQNNQREKIAFDLIEPSLEESSFERIYAKLSNSLSSCIALDREAIDKKPMGNASTSFILTHNGLDDQMFESFVMATVIVKRMSTYECLSRVKGGNIPNAMVYIYDSIKKTADTRIKTMRSSTNTMPRRELPTYDTEDNSSILDHTSKTSKMPFDVPIFITTAVLHWELPKLLEDTQTPIDVFNSAVDYYSTNMFDVSPMTQAIVASFVGTRFGGSKCIGYLPPILYQKVVVIAQIFLIKQGMTDLAMMMSSKTSAMPIDGGSPVGMRIASNFKTLREYSLCRDLFKGYVEKVVPVFGKKATNRKPAPDRIEFVNHIGKLVEWLIRFTHTENMAPALWDYTGVTNRPIVGSECQFDETIVKHLCEFYLLCHGSEKPF